MLVFVGSRKSGEVKSLPVKSGGKSNGTKVRKADKAGPTRSEELSGTNQEKPRMQVKADKAGPTRSEEPAR